MEYIKKVKNVIKENLDRYSSEDNKNSHNNNSNYNNNNNSNNENELENFIINDQLLLETILSMIRGETIKYCSYKNAIMSKK